MGFKTGRSRAATKKKKKNEWAKNTLLVLLAIVVVVIFFNLDLVGKGDSMFSRSGERTLLFSGDMASKDYSASEVKKLVAFLQTNKKWIEKITVNTSKQDDYKAITPNSQMLFVMKLVMADGMEMTTTVRRTTRADLVKTMLIKLRKDVRAYKKMKKDGRRMKTLVNTS